ncbi:MAG: DUF2797 domain-containing protein [Halobacteriales archaeon]
MQIVGYRTGTGGLTYDPVEGIDGEPGPATLVFADDGAVRREPLDPGGDISYTLGRRHCAGTLEGDEHVACDAPAAPYCAEHTSTWLCAQCAGDCELPLEACREEHAVYLAAFAPDRFKVGVTRLWRLPARLREQGADRAAHVRTVSNGRIARRIEAGIAEDLPDRVPTDRKIAGLGADLDEAAWNDLLEGFEVIETYAFDYGVDLADRPVAETLATGEVRGTKGRLLVLENGAGTYAVDLRDLLGHEVEPGATDRDLQASLGAFG